VVAERDPSLRRDQRNAGWPAVGCGGISIAPALDTAAAEIILALPPPCEPFPGLKSLRRTPAVAKTATIAVTIAGFTSPRLSFL
jgi:hypothetical protein